MEKRLLQTAVALACLVPVSAGLSGVFFGMDMLGEPGVNLSADSHFRYLSGLLLGIGFAFLSCIPNIETKTTRVRVLTFLVVIGGIARLYALFVSGIPEFPMIAALGMELIVTPLLCLWQSRIAQNT